MNNQHFRRGTILPLFALVLVSVVGFVAMAVDVGVLAIGLTQCQNAADNAAMAGTRALNGNTGTNTASATATALTAAEANKVLNVSVQSSNVSLATGYLHYNSSSQTFVPTIGAPVSPDNYNLMQATVSQSRPGFFSNALGLSPGTISATATAAYRPRDVTIVIDFSGSMNNETDLWNCEGYLGSDLNTPNNTDSTFPQWGVYSPSFSPSATIQCTKSGDSLVGLCNITTTIAGVPPIVNDFYSNSRGGAAASAFTNVTAATTTAPVGDTYVLKGNAGSIPARSIYEFSGSTSLTNTNNKNFVSKGYKKYATNKSFSGYTEGPGYWGKTFFVWPPDPLVVSGVSNDWRKKFFLTSSGGTVADNRLLYDSNGNWQDPPGNYEINYKAILSWIKTAPAIFPAQLRSGNVMFYTSIPTDVPASAYDHTQSNSNISNADQRFWKEYIDFAIGVWRDPFGNIQRPGSSTCSYGPDFACGDGTGVSISGPDSATQYNGTAFIAPADNPLRPRHRFWFGPMTMIQYMLDTGLIPGTAHDVSMVAAKLGIAGAITDIQNNHPNDMVSLIYYGRPTFTGETGVGVFDNPIVTLGRSYTSMVNALWYPPNSSGSDARPWDTNGNNTPRAHGDYCSNTATSYGLMLAYNQLSGNASLQSSGMGGYGRKGAQRMVILETDGMANVSTTASVTNAGAYQSYYKIGTGNSYSSSSADSSADAIAAANTICGLDSATSNGLPGFSTSSKPVIIQCLAFGALFQSTADPSYSTPAISMLQSISTVGSSTFPSSASDPTNGYKWCIGTLSQRQTLLQQAFTTIMDSSAPIVLVK
jgi:Flp pilus assembly protein TadG